MHLPAVRWFGRTLPAVTAAVLGGYVATWLGVPLGWTVGSLVTMAVVALAGRAPPVPFAVRPVGQIVVASVIGLSFTASALDAVFEHAVVMVLMALLVIVTGLIVAGGLVRAFRLDPTMACLACLPAGPVEISVLAHQYDVPVAPVIFAQTLRIASVAVLIPILVIWLEGSRGSAIHNTEVMGEFAPVHIMLIAGCATGALLFRKLRIPSPYFLGALAVSSSVAASGFAVPTTPPFIMVLGQILLGISLGAAFDRVVLRQAGRLVPAMATAAVAFLPICVGFGLVLSSLFDILPTTMILSACPGSIAEMALTARIVGADVAMVTAFCVVRIFIVIPLASFLIALVRRSTLRGHLRLRDIGDRDS